MISIKASHKLAVCVSFFSVMVFMIPPVFAGANLYAENSGHPQRFWDEKEPDPMAMAVDGLVVRPVSFVATVLGGAFFVVTLPFSAAGGNSGAAWDQMVAAPARATFVRPLGVFHLDFHEQKGSDNRVREPGSANVEPSSTD